MRDIEQLKAKSTRLNSGDILRSRYRILRSLGSGGFSRTYLAEDLNRFNERCVLKEFAPQLKGTSTFVLEKAQELFEREAGVLYRLQHPQIPKFQQLFSYKQQDEGFLFLVQDYVEGTTYHDLLNQRLAAGDRCLDRRREASSVGKVSSPVLKDICLRYPVGTASHKGTGESHCFSEAEVRQLLMQVLPILEYIHSMGVIHRDISPDNLILRTRDELPVLIDFGCIKEVEIKTQSQLREMEVSDPAIPLIATALGKAGYSPPEQVEQGIVYAHSDLYALAATAVVLLTGKEPQQLIDPNDYRWQWRSLVTLSSKLEWILSTMLSPHPSDRFGSAAEVIKTLQDISITTAFKPTQANSPPRLNRQKLTEKAARTGNLLSKSLFFIPFTAVLIFGGYLCLQMANLEVANPMFNADSVESDTRLEDRLSQGEKILISRTTTPEKELAVAAFAKGNYYQAASLLAASLKTVANDPESLIYLNNARIGQAKSYTIAVSVPIGSDVNAAQEILRGVAQAQDRINQGGGINQLPLKVQIINDDNDPEIARKIVENLSQDRDILAVVGHYASDVTLATAPIYEAEKLVAISPISTSVKLSNFSPYIFRTVPSDYIAARALAEYMREHLQQQKVAIFYNSQSNYSESLKSEFATAVSLGGGEVTNTFDLSDANFNAGDRFSEAVNRGAEVIMLAANTSTLDKALQVVQVNDQRLSLLAGDDVYTPKTLQISGEAAQDMVLAIPWHIKSSPDSKFASTARQLWGGNVNWRTAMAYDAAQAIISAIAHTPQPTRISIRQNLANPNLSTTGVEGRVSFLPSGDRLSDIQLVKIQPGSGDRFDFEFTPIVEPK
ncbi:ABC transporter substrate-binding protein [Pleurocapsales cyanobacterium LEGE 10410]|nr:ABC transporter substrate-binding protein [Pleurocapsales cyanobacterium LEGE 10410]